MPTIRTRFIPSKAVKLATEGLDAHLRRKYTLSTAVCEGVCDGAFMTRTGRGCGGDAILVQGRGSGGSGVERVRLMVGDRCAPCVLPRVFLFSGFVTRGQGDRQHSGEHTFLPNLRNTSISLFTQNGHPLKLSPRTSTRNRQTAILWHQDENWSRLKRIRVCFLQNPSKYTSFLLPANCDAL